MVCDLRAMLVGKQPLLPPSQPPSFPSGASLCWAVLDASGALLLLSQSCSAPAELARLLHISGDGKAGLELDSVYKTAEINRHSMAGSRAETVLLKDKKKKEDRISSLFVQFQAAQRISVRDISTLQMIIIIVGFHSFKGLMQIIFYVGE